MIKIDQLQSTLPHPGVEYLGLIDHGREAVLELFLSKINCSTLQAYLASKLQEVETLQKQEVKPMKSCQLHLVSNFLETNQ